MVTMLLHILALHVNAVCDAKTSDAKCTLRSSAFGSAATLCNTALAEFSAAIAAALPLAITGDATAVAAGLSKSGSARAAAAGGLRE